jgi:hypothetical protein
MQGDRKTPETRIEDIPQDILKSIFSFLLLKDLKNTKKICRSWRKITEDTAQENGLADWITFTGNQVDELLIILNKSLEKNFPTLTVKWEIKTKPLNQTSIILKGQILTGDWKRFENYVKSLNIDCLNKAFEKNKSKLIYVGIEDTHYPLELNISSNQQIKEALDDCLQMRVNTFKPI